MTAPTPRDDLASALTEQWLADAEAKRVDSPLGHCERLADAALAHLAERLGSETLREAVETAVTDAWQRGGSDVDAMLATVRAALLGGSDE